MCICYGRVRRQLVARRKELLGAYLNGLLKVPSVVQCSVFKVFWELYDLTGKIAIVTGASAGMCVCVCVAEGVGQ